MEHAGLEALNEGAMFASLIPPRVLTCLKEQIMPPREISGTELGRWRHGPFFTKTVETLLDLDNNLLLVLNKLRIPTAGLTRWAVGRKKA